MISRHVAGFNCMSVIMVSSFFLVFLSVSGCDSEPKTMCIPEMAFFLNGCKHIAYLNIKDILSRVARDFGYGEAFCPWLQLLWSDGKQYCDFCYWADWDRVGILWHDCHCWLQAPGYFLIHPLNCYFMEDDNTGKTELNWRRRETARMTSLVLNLVNDLHMSMMLMKIQLGASRGWILTEQRETKREEERWNSMTWWTYQPEDWMVLHFRLAEQEGCIIQDKSSIHSICAVLWQQGCKWCATSMAWQSCWRRGCQTKWPQTNFSTWFNRLYWNPGRTCFYPWFVFCMWFKLVQKKICIGSSCIGSSHGVPWRNLAWQLMSHLSPYLIITLSLTWFCGSQTLDIVAENPDKFKVVALAAGSNVTLLADQVFFTTLTHDKRQRGKIYPFLGPKLRLIWRSAEPLQ